MTRAAIALILSILAFGCSRAPPAPQPARQAETAVAATIAPRDIGAFFDCLQARDSTLVSAHRGGPAPGYAENAIPTFAHTLSLAPATMETDINRTRDGVLVLMHDDTMDRTTDAHGAVDAMSAADFRAAHLRDDDGRVLDAHPPTLAEALAWADGKTILELDVKRGVPLEEVVAAVRAAHAEQRVMIITYTDDEALRLHRLAPELMISIGIDDAGDIARLQRRGMDLTRVIAWTGTHEPNSALNIALKARGIESRFGTLGPAATSLDARIATQGEAGYAAVAETGIESLATDRPAEAARALRAAGGADPTQCAR